MIPGRMKTARCEYARAGRMKRKDVGVGAAVGVVIGGRPVGRMPKSWGSSAIILIYIFEPLKIPETSCFGVLVKEGKRIGAACASRTGLGELCPQAAREIGDRRERIIV